MQPDPLERGWAAGPRLRRRPGVTAIAAVIAGGIVGGLLGRMIAATVLPGATFAVVALSLVGIAAGGLVATSVLTGGDEDDET